MLQTSFHVTQELIEKSVQIILPTTALSRVCFIAVVSVSLK